ncbi:MAG TPA: glutamate--cysteine ligase [Cryptosporangiaceae bacterium]|nr:glutamate--cysteine ligase [Cryptosporangiaceae bacterium]
MTATTVGVEEEFHLADPVTGSLRQDAPQVLAVARRRLGDAVDPELLRSQAEIGTAVCATLAQVRAELVRLRRGLADSAAAAGCSLLASGTFPGPVREVAPTEKARYVAMMDLFGQTAREQVLCGCHVHVAVDDPELAVAVLRRSRPWMPVLLALSANSPFWHGQDTNYASYRSQVWSWWPSSGPAPALRSRGEYDALVERLLATGVLRDRAMLYWHVRASERYPTVEFRVADVCLAVDDAVLIAGLCRALTRTCVRDEMRGVPEPDLPVEVLQAATWQAARFGVDGALVDPLYGIPVPAASVVDALLEHVREGLDEFGDAAEVQALAADVLGRGSGARRQRSAYARRGEIGDVVDLLARETRPADPC